MSEIPRPVYESLTPDVDTFAKESTYLSDAMATAMEQGTADLENEQGRIDLALRNPGVLLDRANTVPGEIGGQLSEGQSERLNRLNDKAKAILILEEAGPDPSDTNYLLMLPIFASRKVTPQVAPYLAGIIRDGNALVSEVVKTGKVEPSLTRYFASNITAISSSIARTEQR